MLGLVAKPRRRAPEPEDEPAAPLYFEFEDEGDPSESARPLTAASASTLSATPASTISDSPISDSEDERVAAGSAAAAALGLDRRWGPRPPGWWRRWSLRRRILVCGATAAVLVTAVTIDALLVEADRRAHDRVAVSALHGAYVPSSDGEGLDLVLSLRDAGPATATLDWVGVDQPGLALGYPPLPLPMPVGRAVAVRLLGRYMCSGDAATTANTLVAKVQSPRGVVSYLTIALPSDATLPTGWQSARDAFCAGVALTDTPKMP